MGPLWGRFGAVLGSFLGSPPAVFLESLKKRREESGFIIARIGDLLLARVSTRVALACP